MDVRAFIDLKTFQLNQVEIVYQTTRSTWSKNCFKKKKGNSMQKNNYMNCFFLVLKNYKFMKDYFSKTGFSIFPGNQSQSWVFFWFFNSIDVVGNKLNTVIAKKIKNLLLSHFLKRGCKFVNFLNSQNLLNLYSCLMSLCCFKNSLKITTKRDKLMIYIFLRKIDFSCRVRSSFLGESDPRSLFCTLTVCSFLNILTRTILSGIFVKYEFDNNFDGGFGCSKFEESHGAISFCVIGSLIFFSTCNSSKFIDPNFEFWLLKKLKPFESCIQGRLSKLPDSCYIYWIGALSVLCSFLYSFELSDILIFSDKKKKRGFSDQFGKISDLYHTCYATCGLSILMFLRKKKNCLHKNSCGKRKFVFISKLNPVYGIREANVISNLI